MGLIESPILICEFRIYHNIIVFTKKLYLVGHLS
jgi:hypothetical protein